MQTDVLVGRWVIRTAVSLLLTLWPPGPLARMLSILSVEGLMSTEGNRYMSNPFRVLRESMVFQKAERRAMKCVGK